MSNNGGVSISSANKELLNKYRKARNFDPELYCNAKAIILNSYLRKHNINTVMVALSGGIDSAVVLGLLVYASRISGSPIKKIIGINIPLFSTGVSCNQDITLEKSLELKNRFPEIEFRSLDLSNAFDMMVNVISDTMNIETSNWASGQLISNIRAPAIYFANALSFKNENNAVVCGTINRDEGGYIGYFGKVSDSVVDLQLIFDIHKSEVNTLSKYMKIPDSIVGARPTGDVYNGMCDEEFLEVCNNVSNNCFSSGVKLFILGFEFLHICNITSTKLSLTLTLLKYSMACIFLFLNDKILL